MSTSKTVPVEVLPASHMKGPGQTCNVARLTKGKLCNVRQLAVVQPGELSNVKRQTLDVSAEKHWADAIKADLAKGEFHARAAVFCALRVGIILVMVRDNGKHGDLANFMKTHFASKARRSLYNYISIADRFLKESGFKNSKHKLSNTSAVAPILEEQLDLFISPQASKLKGALQKVVKWVQGRTLTQIYKDLSENSSKAPMQRGMDTTDDRLPEPEARRASALSTLADLSSLHESQDWLFLHDGETAHLENTLVIFQADLAQHIKQRRIQQEHLDRAAKNKKA